MKKHQFLPGRAILGLGALAMASSAFAFDPSTLSVWDTAGALNANALVDYLLGTGPGATVHRLGNATMTVPGFGPVTSQAGPSTLGNLGYSAIGLFSATPATGIPFPDGVVMSTGLIDSTYGPNNDSRTSFRYNDPFPPFAPRPYDGSPALEGAAGLGLSAGQTGDGVELDFDFKADGKSIKFQYMFGSEEYYEFVGGGKNDEFAFLLNAGSGFNAGTAVNLAKIGPDPVSVDTVNLGLNSGYYTDNPPSPPAVLPSPYFIQMDGLAGGDGGLKLFATSPVIPGATYHIKLVLADVGADGTHPDDQLDSEVFLKHNSFVSPPVPEPATYVGALALAGLVARKLRRKA